MQEEQKMYGRNFVAFLTAFTKDGEVDLSK